MFKYKKEDAENYPYYYRKVYKINNFLTVERRRIFDWLFAVSIGTDKKSKEYLLINLFNFRIQVKLK